MSKPKIITLSLILVLILAGSWLLLQPGHLTPESSNRQEAVQNALAPGRIRGEGGQRVDGPDKATIVYGDPVSPVAVDIRTLPSRAAEVDKLKEAYETGKLDLDKNEGPVSDAAFQAMVVESKTGSRSLRTKL